MSSLPVLAGRVHRAERADPATEDGFALDEEDPEADVGEPDGGAQPGHAAADHERPLGRLDDDRFERLGQQRPGDPGLDQVDGLVGRALGVLGVDPGGLLADVDLGVLVRVEARLAWPRRGR